MTLSEIKKKWISFFKKNGYFEEKEHSLVPDIEDNSILWINSGVSALKKYFINPNLSPARNIVNSQRVIRTNDIDRIDKSSYHQTLFEMLGCFSIDGNFKKEVIPLVMDFLTNKEFLKIDQSKLFITVFKNDKETFDAWKSYKSFPVKNIILCDEKSNFWDMGEGPCGFNTEIYYCFDLSLIKDMSNIDIENKNFIEIANLVFSDRYHKRNLYVPLEKKCVDVGIGLERICLVNQKVSNTFDIDIWKKPLYFLKSICSKNDNFDVNKEIWKLNVISDHLRTFILSVYDGVLPNSKHRGYIIKKLIKRSFWISHYLGIKKEDLKILSSLIIDSNNHFHDLKKKENYIINIINQELENLSNKVFSYEKEIFSYLQEISESNVSSKIVFFWYDTKGMPIEFIRNFLKERNFSFDEIEFNYLLNNQKNSGHLERKNKKISVF